MDLVGKTLGQYQIIKRIGAGGMAKVYKAYQPGLDRYVAIKVLPAQHALTPNFKERFAREAKAVAQLSHPNILSIHDVGIEGDLSYFVMKYVASERTLRALLGKPMDLSAVSNYVSQMCAALDHAHDRGILHRDIKPDNILLEGEWLLLGDFGLAKIKAGGQGITGTGLVVGTPLYVSPEQIQGRPVDRRTDIYSLGVVLYEMVTGRVPYSGSNPIATMFKHVNETAIQPVALRKDLPPQINKVILKALAKNPDGRYDRAGELADDLFQHLSNRISVPTTRPPVIASGRIFICYERNINPDQDLADFLHRYLNDQGHQVFHERISRTGDTWLEEVDRQIQASDYLVVLLSPTSAVSESVQAELKRAFQYRKRQGHPHTLSVRVNFEDHSPIGIDAFLEQSLDVIWKNALDSGRVAREILSVISGDMLTPPVIQFETANSKQYNEDGEALSDNKALYPPLPRFDPLFIEVLEAPGGVVKLRDELYIERHADARLKRELTKPGTTTTIRASRQTGKSSLLVRGVHFAQERGAKTVVIDLQRMDTERLTSPDLFLREFAELMVRKLRLDVAEIEKVWRGSLGPQYKLTYLMEDYLLPEIEAPIVLALDEVDRLLNLPFHADFFGLLRSWHNSRALDAAWDKVTLVMVISTEPYLLIRDSHQSPFNVGLKIYLEDFDRDQMSDLNTRHGAPVSDDEFEQWRKFLSGQPYLTRQALYTMVSEQMSWPDLLKVADLDHGPFGDHLRRLNWLLGNEPGLRTAFRQVIESETDPNEMALFRLLQAGLIKGQGQAYVCRCDLYRQYFRDKL